MPTATLTPSEAAAALGIHVETLKAASDRGDIPCWRTPGGHRRYSREAIDAVLAERCPDKVEEAS